MIGPHRDDVEILLEQKPILSFASRGEQRLAILSISLGVVDFIEELSKERPVLLLDDIFSELDHYHQKSILEAFSWQQTIITTTEWKSLTKAAVINL